MAPPRQPILERLLSRHRIEGECLIWTGSKTRDGYGVMGVGRGKQVRAHRAAYEVLHGPIPAGMVVRHTCDRPLCINPGHLILGTPKDNTADMDARGRRVSPKIGTHPLYKIPPEERENIRRLRAAGMTLAQLGAQYGVSFQTISAICLQRRTYATGK